MSNRVPHLSDDLLSKIPHFAVPPGRLAWFSDPTVYMFLQENSIFAAHKDNFIFHKTLSLEEPHPSKFNPFDFEYEHDFISSYRKHCNDLQLIPSIATSKLMYGESILIMFNSIDQE